MKYQKLLAESRLHLEKYHCPLPNPTYNQLFSAGAKWMYDRLQELRGNKQKHFPATPHYNLYGFLKYGLSMGVFLAAVFGCIKIDVLLLPLSVVVFYLVEVHLLFLFPLLIDSVRHPVQVSIRLTYQTGLLNAMLTTMPIGFFMMAGLFNIKRPLRNWYIGSLAIIIWYNYEMGNRLPTPG